MTEKEAHKQLGAAVNEVFGRVLFRPKIVWRQGRIQIIDNTMLDPSDFYICGISRKAVIEGLTAYEWTRLPKLIFLKMSCYERMQANENRNSNTH